MSTPTAHDATRWLLVALSKDDLDRLRVRAAGMPIPTGKGPLLPTEQVATHLLIWALDHAPQATPMA